MERAKAKAVLEAILFTMGDSVPIDSLAAVIEEDKKTTREILEEMMQDYSLQDKGIGLTILDKKDNSLIAKQKELQEKDVYQGRVI